MTETDNTACDVLVVSPHTDDAEIGLGGSIRVLANQGRRVWALDLTRGELGTNASSEQRWTEAAAASAVLGLTGRLQLELPDGFISRGDREQVGQVVAVLRRLRPRWVVTAPDPVRHPDHIETPLLVQKAVFMARLQGWQPALGVHHVWSAGAALPEPAQRWLVEAVFGVCPDGGRPALMFDVSEVWAEKTAALACYASQFGRGAGQAPTAINDPAFMAKIERRARDWGRRAGVKLAEAWAGSAAPVVDDLPDDRWSR